MKRLPRFDDVKTTEAAAILLQKANGKMRYIRLLKLLYLADKEALRKWERPITFDDYTSMDYGQVLSNTYNLIKKDTPSESGLWEDTISSSFNKSYLVELIKMPKIQNLSKAEIELLESIHRKYRNFRWGILGILTKGSEYQKPTQEQRSIPTPFSKVLEALDYSEDDIKRIQSDLEDYSYIQELSEI